MSSNPSLSSDSFLNKFGGARLAVLPVVLILLTLFIIVMERPRIPVLVDQDPFVQDADQDSVFQSSQQGSNPALTRCAGTLRLVEIQYPDTALASFPESGSSWFRYLLQEATGLGTSSLHCDRDLEESGFPYECYTGYQQGRPILIMTHAFMHSDWLRAFNRSVVLIRNPYDAIVSYYEWRFSTPQNETTYENAKFRTSAFTDAGVWLSTYTNWLVYYPGLVLPVLYQDLITDLPGQLRRVLKFLELPVNEEALQCVLRYQHDLFYSPTMADTTVNADRFSQAARLIVDKYKELVQDVLEAKYSMSVQL